MREDAYGFSLDTGFSRLTLGIAAMGVPAGPGLATETVSLRGLQHEVQQFVDVVASSLFMCPASAVTWPRGSTP